MHTTRKSHMYKKTIEDSRSRKRRRRAYNAMTKRQRTNNDLQKISQKTKD